MGVNANGNSLGRSERGVLIGMGAIAFGMVLLAFGRGESAMPVLLALLGLMLMECVLAVFCAAHRVANAVREGGGRGRAAEGVGPAPSPVSLHE